MFYVERVPAPPLDRFVKSLWYARSGNLAHRRERVLPSGHVQLILSLSRDFLLDCPEGKTASRRPPALVVGARSVYEIIDTSDIADLVGVVFAPAGFGPFAGDAVHLFSNRSVPLEAIWGASTHDLREKLLALPTAQERLCCLERFLRGRILGRLRNPAPPNGMVAFALGRFAQSGGVATVRAVAQSTGWSERRFSQVFREEVGLSPKTWCRVRRFQQAVKRLHAGAEVRWAELALDCGYYDQSHFANEFRAFSGIDATTYSTSRTRWANHILLD